MMMTKKFLNNEKENELWYLKRLQHYWQKNWNVKFLKLQWKQNSAICLEEELGTEIEMGENRVDTVADLVAMIESKQN